MRIATVFCAALTATFTAHAALPPCAEDQNVKAADTVVQIEVTSVSVPEAFGERELGTCTVKGNVVRVFRGKAESGDPVTVEIYCHAPQGWVGPLHFYAPKTLKKTKAMELHMVGDKPVQRGPGVHVLDAPTDAMVWKPHCS